MIDDLTPAERELAEFMSALSEKCFSAGWMANLEYVLWDAVMLGPRVFGHGTITQDDVDKLTRISNSTKTWIVFDDERDELAIPLDKWQQQFDRDIMKNADLLYNKK